jgi:hypothetical protein
MIEQSPPFPRLFEPHLWRDAGWLAVTFLTPRDVSPTLGLVFRDRDVATAIFTGWQHALGATDTDDLVRVAIIEGNLAGQTRGGDYHVHLSVDTDVLADRARAAGTDPALLASHDVWLTMRGAVATALTRFKDAYQRARRFLLIPGTIDRSGKVELMPHLMIAKHRLALRRVGDVATVNDPDAGFWSR